MNSVLQNRKLGRFRGWRGWILRLSFLVLSPILFFGLLEAGLRLGGYGYPTGFFLGPDADGTCTTNDRFGWRFFPRSLARTPQPCILSPKPAGTVRIFVFGGSAAMGTPDPSFNFGQILGVMLREQYPSVQFEVVNGAMTAINSHVVLEIARDCAARQPDLFVVYMGNNEVIGPYGPGTVFQRWSPSLSMIRASLWVKSTRVGELLGDVGGFFRGDQVVPGHWRGMAMFMKNPVTADDPRLTAVYGNFCRNLTDIFRTARRAHAAVVLSTVAVNLRDFPPLASLHRSDLAAGDLAKWESVYKAAGELEASNRWPEALGQYEAAAKIDDRFAELQFHIGECLLKAGRFAEAGDRFELARDLDVLRFRADSRINAVIREVAGEQEAAGVRLADGERALAQSHPDADHLECGGRPWVHGARPLFKTRGEPFGAEPAVLKSGDDHASMVPAPHSIGPGRDLFYEHVHLTFDGNYLLARAVFDQVCAALPQLAALGRQHAIPSRQRCAELLALTPWDEAQLAADMVDLTSGKPFANQFDHRQRLAAARQRRDCLRRLASTPEAKQAAWGTYEAALAKAPDDWSLHRHFGALAMELGRLDVAVEHFRIALQRVPRNVPIHNDLGIALAGQGRIDEAISHYQSVLEINPDDMVAHFNLGAVLLDRGEVDEAVARFRKALEIGPDFVAPHFKLAVALAGRGQAEEAMAHYQRALEINPDLAVAHNNLGAMLAGRGQVDEAIDHYRKAVEIKPDYEEAHNNLGYLLFRKGAAVEAMASFRKALEIQPDFAEAHYNLGIVLAGRGEVDEAIAHFQKALEIQPGFAAALDKMARIRATHPDREVRPGTQGPVAKESGGKP